MSKVLAVRTDELDALIGAGRTFLALPREEIERLHSSLDVLGLEGDETPPGHTRLRVCTAIHYNYSWFTYGMDNAGVRSMVLNAPLVSDARYVPFLDETTTSAALEEVQRRVAVAAPVELRLAGLSRDHEGDLSLVYVLKLRQPGLEIRDNAVAAVRFEGHRDLLAARDAFEPRSQVLIDNLAAL